MIRLSALLSVALAVLSAHAQCVVKEILPVAPAKAASITVRDWPALERAALAAVEAKDIAALASIAKTAIDAGRFDMLKSVIAAAISVGNIEAVKTTLRIAVASRNFDAIESVVAATVDKWDALGGFAKSMSLISDLVRRGKHLEKIGEDPSDVYRELNKVVEMIILKESRKR